MPETLHGAAEFVTGIGPTHPGALLYLIPLLPLIGAAINGILGYFLQQRFGKKVISFLGVGVLLAAAVVAVVSFFQLLALPSGERTLVNKVLPMISIGSLQLDLTFMMDELSGTMSLIVTIIGMLIHVYSTGYMHDDESYWRYFSYLNLFVFSMMMLVLGDSFLLMFFGWEGVGLCSYLLIGFWYQDQAKATAGMKAFIVNRVGDFGFVVGLLFLFWSLGGVWFGAQYAPVHGLGSDASAREVRYVVARPAHASHGTAWRGDHGTPTTVAVRLGPTVSFRELKGQLTLKNAAGKRPIVDGGEVAVHSRAERGSAAVVKTEPLTLTYGGLANMLVWGIPVLFLACLGFFLGASGKSAQIPLYVWLPDAMAGPTPVSALIHAATMVTAGVYMVARLNFLFALSPGAMTVVAVVGAATAFFAATIGLFQYDIKKVLAYSTVSQLGYMFVGVGIGAYWVGIFHLLTHAAFKACLFLGSGSVIHGMHYVQHHPGHDDPGHGHDAHEPRDLRLEPDPSDPQDMRNMGGLAGLMPVTRWTYLIACIAIAGLPFASGFYSKDEILFKAFTTGNLVAPLAGKLVWTLCTLGAALTAFYMFRSYYLTFRYRAPSKAHEEHVHESPRSMTWVLVALATLAVVLSLLGLPKLWTGTDPLFERFLEPVFAAAALKGFAHASHGLEWGLMLLSVAIAAGGIGVAWLFYADEQKTAARLAALKERFAPLHRVVFNKYYVDELYAATVLRGTHGLARMLAWFDREIIDGLVNFCGWCGRVGAWLNGKIDEYFVDGAVNLVADIVIGSGQRLKRMQTGRINSYAYGVAVGVIAIALVAYFLPGVLK
ncbi:MAG: NADH-quinone oxidoreductase subunit L [Deltaproteobacteria bacterium]|nr:NADH-quinone oxidoreductase subunit L [Deltaproteobacteria bacterium]